MYFLNIYDIFISEKFSHSDLRGCAGNRGPITQAAHSSGSDDSDFTGDGGIKCFRIPSGGLYVSRHRYGDFGVFENVTTERCSGLFVSSL